ncbi:MAG: hypothetical protein SCABRO_03709 [Candidatus Scalindua brodae]|uniref:Uncharacterized protein n=1 Tax=Candidatus Scalindua brodae TaxID=237368 RepID=A0A0B0EHF1_9BACT|nr:MAG: hypothetical protein SCABRO_03709 [Candidatus Scalindua brodae]
MVFIQEQSSLTKTLTEMQFDISTVSQIHQWRDFRLELIARDKPRMIAIHAILSII